MIKLTHIGKSRKLFPKNGRWHRGYPGNFLQTFSRFCNFEAWPRRFSGNYYQVTFLSAYPLKNIFPKNGAWLRGFSGNFSQYLEKVSGNYPGSLPEFLKFQISFKIIDFGKSFTMYDYALLRFFRKISIFWLGKLVWAIEKKGWTVHWFQ